jgi:hypothetical protein
MTKNYLHYLSLDDTIKEEIGNFLKLESIKDKEPLKRSQSLDDLDVLRTSFIRTNGNFIEN